MRKKLKELKQQRTKFGGTVVRFGTKSAFRGPDLRTILLSNVIRCDTGAVVTDHIWFTVGLTLDRLDLRPGDYIEFDARVTIYRKGIYHDEFDYKLSRPTNFEVTRLPQPLAA